MTPAPFHPLWALSADTLDILLEYAKDARVSLELGSGLSTVALARHVGRHIALEQDPDFWAQTLEHLCNEGLTCELALSPLVDGFYPLPESLEPASVDLLLVDGPDHGGDRSRALRVLDPYLTDDAVVIVDDADRETWAANVPGWTTTYKPAVRGCAVLTRTS